MKKASLFASAATATVLGLAAVPAFAQGGGPFADVPTDHWAYQSVDRLQREGIVIGYPDGTYGGRRAMTRYEFAVAIARLLDKLPQGGDFATRQQLDDAIAGIRRELGGFATREEVDNLRRLVNEFQNELTTLGVEVDNVRRRLDGLEGRVGLIEQEMKRVRIGGSVNLMVRGAHARGNATQVTDADGFDTLGGSGNGGVGPRRSILSNTRVLHDLDLDITARLSDTATAKAQVNFGNYLPFLGSIVHPTGNRGGGVGPTGQDQDNTITKLMLEAPIRLPALGAVNLAVGRIPVQLTPYTLKQIDVDSYFYNTKTDLGDIPVDGYNVNFKIGPVGITHILAKVDPIKNVSNLNGEIDGEGNYGLFAGAGVAPFGRNFTTRPKGSLIRRTPADGPQVATGLANGAMPIEQFGAFRATLGTSALGTIGATYLFSGGASQNPGVASPTNFDRVYVYGADINTNFGGIGLSGSYTVSNTANSQGESGGDVNTVRDDDTYAWEAAAAFNAGSLSLGAGYRYISPFFAAPGYWDKVGAWTNPVDVKGPFVRASYALGGGLALTGEAKFYTGTDATAATLSDDSKVTNFRAGIKYGLTSASAVDLGVEYTRYESPNFGDAEPREVFYNIGYGFSFNPNTSLKLLYQVVDFADKGTGFDPGSGRGGVGAAQFSVKF